MSSTPEIATLDYVAEVAKDWVVSTFAATLDSGFVIAPHRFELAGFSVRRRRLARRSREATNPLACAGRPRTPLAWARADMVVLLADTETGPIAYQQEIVEIVGVQEDEVLVEAAYIVRTPDLPPCLGSFWPVS